VTRPALEVADIFRDCGAQYRQIHGPSMSRDQHRAMRAIEVCRTAFLGGHIDFCDCCGKERNSYNSCRNRHCPKCQSLAKAQWLEARMADLLPCGYYHVVFTVPEEVASVAFQNKKIVYTILFRAASETLRAIAADPKHLGAAIGFLAVLHTWSQTLLHHPHLHCVVPAGGLSADCSQWMSCREGFFLPVRVLSRLFREKFLCYLKQAFDQGKLQFLADLQPLAHPHAFRSFLRRNRESEWVVYAKPPFGGPSQVLDYLGRYTHRVAISNNRLVAFQDGNVSFQWKDRKKRNRTRTMTLNAHEFIRRFLMHVLPRGFAKLRYFGFLANRHRRSRLSLCRRLLNAPPPEIDPQFLDWKSRHQALTGESLDICPACHQGRMHLLQILPPLWKRKSDQHPITFQHRIHSP
jgi:Putative transposase/Transposase zinc-binding domain